MPSPGGHPIGSGWSDDDDDGGDKEETKTQYAAAADGGGGGGGGGAAPVSADTAASIGDWAAPAPPATKEEISGTRGNSNGGAVDRDTAASVSDWAPAAPAVAPPRAAAAARPSSLSPATFRRLSRKSSIRGLQRAKAQSEAQRGWRGALDTASILLMREGPQGSPRMVWYNLVAIAFAFFQAFSVFTVWESVSVQKQLASNFDPDGIFDAGDGINNYADFFDWTGTYFDRWSTGSATVDANGIAFDDVRSPGKRSLAFQWHAAMLVQTRDDHLPACPPNPSQRTAAATRFMRTLCDYDSPGNFGREWSAEAGAMVACPLFNFSSTPGMLNPFTKFQRGQNGYTPSPGQYDPRTGKFAMYIDTWEAIALLGGLKDCHWVDQKTRQVDNLLVYFAPATKQVGRLRHTVKFSSTGQPSTDRQLEIYTYDISKDVSAVLMMVFMIHKALMSCFGFMRVMLMSMIDAVLTYMGRTDRKGGRRRCREYGGLWTFAFAHVPFAVCIWYAVLQYLSASRSQALYDTMAEIGTTREELGVAIGGYKLKDQLNFQLEEAFRTKDSLRYCTIAFFLSSGADLFRHFYANTHFSMVPRTLLGSCEELVYVVVIAFCISLVYATFIVLRYGTLNDRWASPISALMQSALIFFGEFQDFYEGMAEEIPSSEVVPFFVAFLVYMMLMLVVVFVSGRVAVPPVV